MHESRNGALESKLAEHRALIEKNQNLIKSHLREIVSHKENQSAQEAAMKKMIKDYESKIYNLQTIISDNTDVIKENGNHVFFLFRKTKTNKKKAVHLFANFKHFFS